MKNNKKRITWGFNQAYDYNRQIKKRRNTSNAVKDQKTVTVMELIQDLLSQVYEDEKQRKFMIKIISKNMQDIEQYDNKYFVLQDEQQNNITSHAQQEPKQLQVQVIKAIKLPLQKIKRVSNLNRLSNKRQAVVEVCNNNAFDKVSTQIEINKLKKNSFALKYKRQYTMIMKTQYTSQTKSIYQNSYIDDIDIDIERLRKIKTKLIKNKSKMIKNQQQLLNNKKSIKPIREFDDLTNYMPSRNLSKMTSKRNSIDFRQNLSLCEPKVIAKESKAIQTKNIRQMEQQSYRYPSVEYYREDTRIVNSLSCSSRQQLKQILQTSFHANNKNKLKYISDKQTQTRTKNSISTDHLPRITKL